jgi:hypothetical protein
MSEPSAWTSLLSGGIGAGGAILAQLATSRSTRKRDEKRIKFEQEQFLSQLQTEQKRFEEKLRFEKEHSSAQLEWNRNEKFIDRKRDIYTQFLKSTFNIQFQLWSLTQTEYQHGPDWENSIPILVKSETDDINLLIAELQLLGETTIYRTTRTVYADYLGARRMLLEAEAKPLSERREIIETINKGRNDLAEIMQQDLLKRSLNVV